MKRDISQIIKYVTENINPQKTLTEALQKTSFNDGRIFVIAIGKAAWVMADTASKVLGKRITKGLVITKYGHLKGEIENFDLYEAGHPLADENTLKATQIAWQLTDDLKENDSVIFLLSGGGSALFELPVGSLDQLQRISSQLIRSSASIVEINTIRKRLSRVKGGKFARHCQPARVYNFVLSDVIGNHLDMVASGPTVNDSSTMKQAEELLARYHLENVKLEDTVNDLTNVENQVIGDVSILAQCAEEICQRLGYQSKVARTDLTCSDIEAAKLLTGMAHCHQSSDKSLALIYSGEITTEVTGSGLGGRNQQLALRCAKDLRKTRRTTIIALGSDGTDGPTDAAGGYVNSYSWRKSRKKQIDIDSYLKNNDSYHALEKLDQLIITGPTNSNLNDLYLVLIKR